MSFGGDFGHDDSDRLDLGSKKITHHILDRKDFKKKSNREYVQPQWIVDCLNNLHLLPTQTYFPGMAPPPHLSPFVNDAKEGYIPDRAKEINALTGKEVELDEESEESESEQEEEPKKEEKKPVKNKGDADDSSDEELDEETTKADKVKKYKKLKKDLKKEQEELGKIMMTKKQRRIYSKVDHSMKKKKEYAKKLKTKKEKTRSK